MAEKKEHKIVSASDAAAAKKPAAKKETTTTESGKTVVQAKKTGNATGLRIGAVLCWIAAIACEVFGILMVFGKVNITFVSTLVAIIGVIVIDLIFVIVAALLWKKSNDIDPASKKNKVKFWLWNNLGFIMNIVAFLPLLIIILSNKNLDKKTKTIGTIVAVIALLVGGLVSYDWNPVSAEDKAAAEQYISGNVFWTTFGKCYHTSEDCQALNNSDTLTTGTVDEAIAANRNRLCSFCAKRDNISSEVVTDNIDVSDEDIVEVKE